jgi:hypothetical protein
MTLQDALPAAPDSWAARFAARREAEISTDGTIGVPGARFNSSPA